MKNRNMGSITEASYAGYRTVTRMVTAAMVLLFLLITVSLAVYFLRYARLASASDTSSHTVSEGSGLLLDNPNSGLSDGDVEGIFLVNVVSEFNEDLIINGNVRADGSTIDLGDGVIYASNIISELVSGTGISVVEGSDGIIQITNTDTGSDQEIFKTIRIGDAVIAAASNSDELRIAADESASIRIEDGEIIIGVNQDFVAMKSDIPGNTGSNGSSGSGITNDTDTPEPDDSDDSSDPPDTTEIEDTDGIEDTGSTIVLEDLDDKLALGTTAAAGKLHILPSRNQPALIIEQADGQDTNLTEWRDSDGNPLITIDKDGNARFIKQVTLGGSEISGDTIAFTGEGSSLVLDMKTDEPENLFRNGELDENSDEWTVTTPSLTNQTVNGEFTSNLSGWVGEIDGSSFPNLFSNTGFNSSLAGWDLSGGGLYQSDEFTVPTLKPYHVTTAPDGTVWYTTTANTIGRVTQSGIISEYTTPSTVSIGQITTGPDGNVWYISSATNKVGRVSVADGTITEYAVGSGGQGIAPGPDGNIWYTLSGAGRVGKMTVTGTVLDEYSIPGGGGPRDIIAGPDGNMYISLESADKIGRMSTDGTYEEVGSVSDTPRGITAGPSGTDTIWFATFNGNTIGKIDVDTDTITEYSTGPAGISSIYDIVADNRGYVWFTGTGSRSIGRSTMTGDIGSYGSTSANPRGITSGPAGNLWYAADNSGKVGRFRITGPEHSSGTGFGGAGGSVFVPANAVATNVSQAVTTGDSRSYILSAHVLLDGGGVVNGANAQLIVNGSAVATTYTPVGADWYKLEATITGSTASVGYGVRIRANTAAYIDQVSLRAASTGEHQVNPSFNQIGSVLVSAPPGESAIFTQTAPFTDNSYTIRLYAYTDGSPVTTGDLELIVNGSGIPTVITSSGEPGWYQISGAFSGSEAQGSYGITVKPGKSVTIDSVSLRLASIADSFVYSTDDPVYGDSGGAVRINTLGRESIIMYQNVTLASAASYTLTAQVYNNTPGSIEGPIDASLAQVTIDGTPLSGISYVPSRDGFYTVSGKVFLSPGTYQAGLRVPSGSRIVADSLRFIEGSGRDKTLQIANSGSGLAKLSVESTTILNSGVPENEALIVVGSSGQTANLSEWKNATNDTLVVIDGEGKVGIGTAEPEYGLSVLGNETENPITLIHNESEIDTPQSGLLKLSLGVDPGGVDSRFIQFYAGADGGEGGTGVGRIRLNNGGVAYESGGADFAEYFTSALPDKEYRPGDVMVITADGTVDTTVDEYNDNAIGVVSDTAAFVGNATLNDDNDGKHVLVGVVGQIETNVTTINGPIRAGDKLTTSVSSGYAMKADGAGAVIGIALEDFIGESDTFSASEEATLADDTDSSVSVSKGRVRAYINPAWYGGERSSGAVAGVSTGPSGTDTRSGDSHHSDTALEHHREGSVLPGTTLSDTIIDAGLTVTGESNLYRLSVTETLTTGLLSIEGLSGEGNAEINTLSGNLLLQAHASGAIELMGGRAEIDTEGNFTSEGTITSAGTISTGSDINADGDVISEGTVTAFGDVDASGNVIVGKDLLLKHGVILGNSQFAGNVVIPAGQREIQIENNWENPPQSVVATSHSDSVVAVSVPKITKDGMTLRIEEALKEDVRVSWFAVF